MYDYLNSFTLEQLIQTYRAANQHSDFSSYCLAAECKKRIDELAA
jgi:hypothetical protein